MKKIIVLLISFGLWLTNSNGQDSLSLRKTILALMKDAANEFVKTKGTPIADTSAQYSFFKSKTIINGSTSEIIINRDNAKRFIADFDLTQPANQRPALLTENIVADIMAEMEANGDYYISYDNDIYKMVAGYKRKYLLTNNDEIIIEIEKAPKFLSLNIYAKSWGTNVSEGTKRPRLF